MLFAVLAVIIMAVINAYLDFRIIAGGKSPDHNKEAVLRGLTILFIAIIFNGHWLLIVFRFIALASVFWIVFEIILNWLRHRPLLYVGDNAKTDLFAKSIFPIHTGRFLLIFKISLLIASICLMERFGQGSVLPQLHSF